MKFTIRQKKDYNVKYLDIYLPTEIEPSEICIFDNKNYEDCTWKGFFSIYPNFKGKDPNTGENVFYLRVNVQSGRVENWSIPYAGDFNDIKVVDEGTYILRDEKENIVSSQMHTYVPPCLDVDTSGYGDYLQFHVTSNGFIENWGFDDKDFEAFMETEDNVVSKVDTKILEPILSQLSFIEGNIYGLAVTNERMQYLIKEVQKLRNLIEGLS